MTAIYSLAQGRAAENASGRSLSDLVRASAGAVEQAVREELGDGDRVLLLVGPGYNGVDALVAGAALAAQGRQVSAWQAMGSVVADAWSAFQDAGGQEVSTEGLPDAVKQADLVVDGVFGQGSRPGLPEPVAAAAELCRQAGARVLAVDLPTGLTPDTTGPTGATFTAARTVALGYFSACHLLGAAGLRCGTVTEAPMPIELGEASIVAWSADQVAAVWPRPPEDDRPAGRVGIDAGSPDQPGAAVLACAGALYAGAGLVRYLGPAPVSDQLLAELPSVTCQDGPVEAWLAGTGWGDLDDGPARLQMALDSGLPLVLDDAAGEYLNQHLGRPDVILVATWATLAGLLRTSVDQVQVNAPAAARRAAGELGVTVLLKGSPVCVASPRTSQVQVPVPGPAWTRPAGSDDVLAGTCAALLANGVESETAAVLAASLQSLAGLRHPGPWPAGEAVRLFPATVAGLVG
ncbi:MAG: NAD(P)H-hydrate epimerase [Actinomycetia bacterium]|nr:NAD(P)H-hydrate epimerase [Actinomycetes bacterium]